jgi:hypothetical protein
MGLPSSKNHSNFSGIARIAGPVSAVLVLLPECHLLESHGLLLAHLHNPHICGRRRRVVGLLYRRRLNDHLLVIGSPLNKRSGITRMLSSSRKGKAWCGK